MTVTTDGRDEQGAARVAAGGLDGWRKSTESDGRGCGTVLLYESPNARREIAACCVESWSGTAACRLDEDDSLELERERPDCARGVADPPLDWPT